MRHRLRSLAATVSIALLAVAAGAPAPAAAGERSSAARVDVAHGAPSPDAAPALRADAAALQRELDAGSNPAEAVHSQVRSSAAAFFDGADESSSSSTASDEGTVDSEFAHPAGDFDGDGLDDVLGTALVEVTDEYGGSTFDGTMRLRARRGVDGLPLWSRTMNVFDSDLATANLGPEGRGGLLLARYAQAASGNAGNTERFDVELEAVGGDGATLWTREMTTTVTSHGNVVTIENVPGGATMLDAVGGPADDLVALSYDTTVVNGMVQHTRTVATVIDGTTGATTATTVDPTLGLLDSGGDPWLLAVDDVTGDDLEDFAFVTLQDGGTASVSLYGGEGAGLQWRRSGLQAAGYPYLFTVGDMTQDGVDELALYSDDYGWGRGWTSILDGSLGLTHWSGTDVFPYVLGDVDGDGTAELGTTLFHLEDDDMAVEVQARDRRGAVVRSTLISVPTPVDELYGYVQVGGDVDADGLDEIMFDLWANGSQIGEHHRQGIVSGKDGAVRWEGYPPGAEFVNPLYATVDGAGDDIAAVDNYPARDSVLTALDGATGAALWSVTMDGNRYHAPYVTDVNDLTGDGRAELFVTSNRGDAGVIMSPDGEVLWEH